MAGIKYWLWLRNLSGLGNMACHRVLEHFGTPERAYYADAGEYDLVKDLTAFQKKALRNKNMDAAEKILEDCARLGIRTVALMDADYPARLRSIQDAPCLLYVKGAWPDFDSEAAVAVIGTRHATPYGIAVGERLGCELSQGGAYIVSGMAAGGDAAGHRGALRAGKMTAAVLGGGVDVIYPRENERLYHDIEAGGVLISEYPPGTRPIGDHFLQRNRIISGLCVAVIVVEAGVRSGTLNTVRHANEQGRDIYAVPGPVDAPLSQGCNRLIQAGAGLVVNSSDVLWELRLRFPERIETKLAPLDHPPMPERVWSRTEEAEGAAEKDAPAADEAEWEHISLRTARDRFTDDQLQILQLLTDRPAHTDDIAEEAQLPVRRVLSALTFLEIEGVVSKESGDRYRRRAVLEE